MCVHILQVPDTEIYDSRDITNIIHIEEGHSNTPHTHFRYCHTPTQCYGHPINGIKATRQREVPTTTYKTRLYFNSRMCAYIVLKIR